MGLAALVVFAAQLALAILGAVVARAMKPVAALLGAAAFMVAPWFAGEPAARGLTALIGGVGVMRVLDAVREPQPWTAGRRVIHVLSFVDSRTLRRAPPSLDVRALAQVVAWTVLALAAFWIAQRPHLAARWGGGVVFVYAAIEAGYALFAFQYRALGFITPRLHALPIASLTIAELWGLRWARPVSAWLRDTCFQPLARAGRPRLGLFMAFLASALGHAYPALVAWDLAMAALMLAFFVVQACFVIAERALGVARWPKGRRRAWTISLMLASSPLFVEPALRVLGV